MFKFLTNTFNYLANVFRYFMLGYDKFYTEANKQLADIYTPRFENNPSKLKALEEVLKNQHTFDGYWGYSEFSDQYHFYYTYKNVGKGYSNLVKIVKCKIRVLENISYIPIELLDVVYKDTGKIFTFKFTTGGGGSGAFINKNVNESENEKKFIMQGKNWYEN